MSCTQKVRRRGEGKMGNVWDCESSNVNHLDSRDINCAWSWVSGHCMYCSHTDRGRVFVWIRSKGRVFVCGSGSKRGHVCVPVLRWYTVPWLTLVDEVHFAQSYTAPRGIDCVFQLTFRVGKTHWWKRMRLQRHTQSSLQPPSHTNIITISTPVPPNKTVHIYNVCVYSLLSCSNFTMAAERLRILNAILCLNMA